MGAARQPKCVLEAKSKRLSERLWLKIVCFQISTISRAQVKVRLTKTSPLRRNRDRGKVRRSGHEPQTTAKVWGHSLVPVRSTKKKQKRNFLIKIPRVHSRLLE